MILTFGGNTLDTGCYRLEREGKVIGLRRMLFDLLLYLIRQRHRVVLRDELLQRLWDERFVSEATLTSSVKELRRAVGDSGHRQQTIETVRGRGYRFIACLQKPAITAPAPRVPLLEVAGWVTVSTWDGVGLTCHGQRAGQASWARVVSSSAPV